MGLWWKQEGQGESRSEGFPAGNTGDRRFPPAPAVTSSPRFNTEIWRKALGPAGVSACEEKEIAKCLCYKY
jgi:hypothetical protein